MNEFIKNRIIKKQIKINLSQNKIKELRCIGNMYVYNPANLEFYTGKTEYSLSTIKKSISYSLENYFYDTYNPSHNSIKLDIHAILNGYNIKPLALLFSNQLIIPFYKMAKGRRT